MCLVMENSVYVLLEGLGLCRSFSVRAPTFPSGTVQGLGSMWRSDEKASGYSLFPHDLTRHLHSALAFQKLCSSNSFFTDKLNRGQRVVIWRKLDLSLENKNCQIFNWKLLGDILGRAVWRRSLPRQDLRTSWAPITGKNPHSSWSQPPNCLGQVNTLPPFSLSSVLHLHHTVHGSEKA